MSAPLPPLWHETEEGEVAVPVRDGSVRTKTARPTALIPARRMPAAVIGILMVAALGMTMTRGWTVLLGQAATDTQLRVIITETGATPQSITVAAGQNVLFRNNASIPQLLRFETLLDGSGKPIETSPIFPLSEARISIPAGIPPGEYPYFSSTSVNVSGVIVVIAPGTATQAISSAASSMRPGVFPPIAVSSAAPVGTASVAPLAQSSSSAALPVPIAPKVQIPTNPYIIGSDTNQVTVLPPAATVTPGITEHMPLSTTETGSAAWATVLIFALSLAFVLRKAKA